jgi:hypothetical protein
LTAVPAAGRPRWRRPEAIVSLHAATRVLMLAGGAINVLFVATHRSAAEQGVYFVFAAAFQLIGIVEQGLGATVVQFAGRAVQRDDAEQGALARSASAWYRRAAIVLALLLAPAALVVAARAPGHSLRSALLWLALVAAIAIYTTIVPRLTTLEGRLELISLQRMRLLQSAAGPLTILALLQVAGADVAVLGGTLVTLGIAVAWLSRWQPAFTARWREWMRGTPAAVPLFAAAQTQALVSWLSPVVATQGLVWSSLAVFDSGTAGRVGLTTTLATAPMFIATAWLLARFPRFGQLAESGDWGALHDLASHATREAMAIGLLGSAALVAFVALLPHVVPSAATRMLGWVATAAFCVYQLAYIWCVGLAGHARADGLELLSGAALLGTVASLAAAALTVASGHGADAALIAFAIGGVLGMGPLAWHRHRHWSLARLGPPAPQSLGHLAPQTKGETASN